MGIFNKVKERERKLFPKTPGKHPGITRETPGKGAFTNILHKRSRLRKKTSLAKLVGIFDKAKEKNHAPENSREIPEKHPGNTWERCIY